MQMKASDYIAAFLRRHEIEYIFEVAGGMITHILDSCYRLGKTNIISVHHEQAAAFAADAYGRCTGKPGVALATSGPGATNLLTGIGSCYFDSSPALFITGQVNTHEQKGERKIRQLGFQETDIVAMAKPITKKCYRVHEANQLVPMLNEAYEQAISGRPGPVLIDIPINIQNSKITAPEITQIQPKKIVNKTLTEQIDTLYQAMQLAKQPLILIGRGVQSAFAVAEFLEFVALTNIPVVSSLMAIDVLPWHHPMRVGLIGTYGNRFSNLAIGEADLLIVIGSRLDIRQTGADVKGFSKDKIIFHIDCDEHEINNRVQGCIPIIVDTKDFLRRANKQFCCCSFKSFSTWLNKISLLKAAWPDTAELKNFEGINPNILMHSLSQKSQQAIAYVADVGNHQMWAAQSLEMNVSQLFLTSGGMGAMGFALPAAIGSSFAYGKKPVVAIIGDGAFQMNIQELQTIVRNSLPIKIVVVNNQSLGMIRQFQDNYFEGRYQSTYWGYSAPDFAAIAKAYGIAAKTITTTSALAKGAEWLWKDSHLPALLQVMINPQMNVYPKIAFGKPITEMEPFAKPIEMEGT